MRRWIFIVVSWALITACAAPRLRGTIPDISEQELLSGAVIFGEPIDIADIADPGIFQLDDEMRAFVAEHVDSDRPDRDRMRRLLNGMIETGLMSLDYNDTKTKTARETFHDRIGNCMSFTSLFVALAREANLDVSFQTVEIPPVWYSDSDLIILNNHVNTLVRQKFEGEVIVDFNVMDLKGDYETKVVSDEYALALYYNNVAMDALRAGKDKESFRLLKKSIETYRDIAGNWANLGVIYSRNKQYDYAIKANSIALDLDKDHRPSLTNLAALYQLMGDKKLAKYYAHQIKRHQERNPYYHYSNALAAYNNGDLDTASERLKRAFHLYGDEHKFYRLQGLIYARQGDTEMAIHSFTRARDLAVYSDARRIYDSKIALLSDRP
jgi:tetratricopeptide (TPR) repeat protein